MFGHERLDCYQCALQFAAVSFNALRSISRGHGDLADQLRRATTSIILNIAEGAGKTTAKDQARFHAIARGSAMECAAVFDVLRLQSAVDAELAQQAKGTLERVVAMLTRMTQ